MRREQLQPPVHPRNPAPEFESPRIIVRSRDAGVEGRYRRSFELMRLDTLGTERQAGDPEMLGAFQRWQDPAWKRLTLALR